MVVVVYKIVDRNSSNIENYNNYKQNLIFSVSKILNDAVLNVETNIRSILRYYCQVLGNLHEYMYVYSNFGLVECLAIAIDIMLRVRENIVLI